MRSVQQKLEDVEATLAKAETKRDSADEAGDKDKYAKYDREVTRLSSSVDALNIRIAAEKQAGKVPPHFHQSPVIFSITFCLCLLCVCLSASSSCVFRCWFGVAGNGKLCWCSLGVLREFC